MEVEVQRLRAEVVELRAALDAEKLARMKLEGRMDEVMENIGRLAVSQRLAAPATADGGETLLELAAAHAQYLREEAGNSLAARAPAAAPAGSDKMDASDNAYWDLHRVGSWQGEIRDDMRPNLIAGTPSHGGKKLASATEDEYWSQHF